MDTIKPQAATWGAYRTNFSRSVTPSPVEINRPLPHDPEAEQGVLQACFADPEGVDRAREHITPEDFYRRGYGIIFQRFVAFRDQQRAYTPTTVLESFRNHPEFEQIETAIWELAPFVTGQTSRHFAKIVKDFSIRRSLINAAVKLATDSFAITPDIDEIIDEFSTTIRGLKIYGGANG
jgi:replicative DNA helicase